MNYYNCQSYKSCTSFLDEKIMDICQNEYRCFLKLPNVVGVGLGYKYTGGIKTCRKCITVMVKKKVPANMLSKEDIVPKCYNKISTDVYETGEISASILDNSSKGVFDKRIRPVLGGYSIGSAFVRTGGTMTCLVTDGIDEYILTNAHVVAPRNDFIAGTPLLQPSIKDGGSYPEDQVGYIKTVIPIEYITETSQPENEIDAALCKVTDRTLVSNRIAKIGQLPPIYPFIEEGGVVLKIGKTTGVTQGFIQFVSVTVNVNFDGNKAIFKNLIVASVPATLGDSGAILVRQFAYNPIGMLIGASKNISAYAYIGNVVQALGVHIL